jgi:hypothetical protein
MAVKRLGILGVGVGKTKAPTVKMEPVTLIGKGRQNLTCSVYYEYEINNKIFFLNRLFFGEGGEGVILDLDRYIFPWQTCFFGGLS